MQLSHAHLHIYFTFANIINVPVKAANGKYNGSTKLAIMSTLPTLRVCEKHDLVSAMAMA